MNGFMAYIIPVGAGGQVDPGYGVGQPGGHPSQPIHHPGHPSHGLPSQPGHPSQPIYHPGHPDHGRPVDPGYGQGGRDHISNRPPGSGGGHPDQSLPWGPNSPDNSLPVPPGINPPNIPPTYKDKLVVLWRMPNTVEWHGKAVDPASAPRPDQGLPPTPEPK